MQLSKYFNKASKNGDVGIEVEVEFLPGTPTDIQVDSSWLVTNDPSLKNGIEVIARQPFKVGPTLLPKIKQLTDALSATGNVDDGNERASVHVHVNVGHLTAVQVLNAVVAYWLIEDVMMLYCGPTRYNNHFCLRLSSSPATALLVMNSCQERKSFFNFHKDTFKYGSINLATIASINSLEFRGMRSTIDPDVIHEWATAVHHLVNTAAKNFDDPSKVFEQYLDSQKDSFLLQVLPSSFVSKLAAYKDYYHLCRRSRRIIGSLAFAVDDWSQWQKDVIALQNQSADSHGENFTTSTDAFGD
jgi:hypothetical protein